MKTTIISLNTKVSVVDDMKQDRDQARVYLKQSEVKREELHVHIKETIVKVETDTGDHKVFQDSLITENDEKSSEIKRLNVLIAQKEIEHSESMNKLEQEKNEQRARLEREKNTEVERLTKENYETMTKIEKEKNERVESLETEKNEIRDTL